MSLVLDTEFLTLVQEEPHEWFIYRALAIFAYQHPIETANDVYRKALDEAHTAYLEAFEAS